MKGLVIENVYEAYTNSDGIEGRGGDVHIGYFTHLGDAKNAAIGRGVMGTNAAVRTVNKTIVIFENYKEYEEMMLGATIQRALSKLTLEERQALGLPSKGK